MSIMDDGPISPLKRLRSDESGVAMILVMAVILIASLLAAAAISSSTNTVQRRPAQRSRSSGWGS
jgi:Tfp pilus assembly protein PilE